MKTHKGTLIALFTTLLLPSFALAQIQPNTFSHIIIVVQENRTPDNIFGAYGGTTNHLCVPGEDPFEPGVDIEDGGYTYNGTQRSLICNVSQEMNAGINPGHENEDWTADYRNGNMDGFCHTLNAELQPVYGPCPGNGQPSEYSFVRKSDVQPYYDIATNYGFANYMFETNEGPSFEAHQFLFTGTSAPVAPHDLHDYYWDFVQDNPGFYDSGCPVATGGPSWIEPNGYILTTLPFGWECYAHDSLVTGSSCSQGVCDKNVTWQYYAPNAGVIWDAPGAIPEVCYGEDDTTYTGSACGSVNGGLEWSEHMTFYTGPLGGAPIFSDIANCKLQQISWVIPDYAWSDHPGFSSINPPAGPSWVGDIVNAVGQSYAGSGEKCDYWGNPSHSGITPEPTAIFIVWDDWGGFFDHVAPYSALQLNAQQGSGYTPCNPASPYNQWGCGYVYGFRVPFMVVSEYTGTYLNGQYSGYVSGACGAGQAQSCPNLNNPFVHDFGSILAFTEWNFNLQPIDGPPDDGYADYNALDWNPEHTVAPLSDFFPLYTAQQPTGRPFVSISTGYDVGYFQNYYANTGSTPTGPDTD